MIYLLKDDSGDYKVGTSDYSLEVLCTREGDEESASILLDYLKNFLHNTDPDIDIDYFESELIKRFSTYHIITDSMVENFVYEMGDENAREFLKDNPLFYDYVRSKMGEVGL